MRVTVFGPTRIVTPNGDALRGGLGGVKPRQVLEILAVSAGTPVSKDALADLLWAGRPPRSHLGTLESYVCLLRRHLGRGGVDATAVVTVRQGYLLDPRVLEVDLDRFRSLVRTAETDRDPARCLGLLDEALALVTGDLFADEMYAPWAVTEREALRAQLVLAEALAAACALALARPAVAVRHARAALARDPLAEGVWRTLMRALAADGRRAEALGAYSAARHHLADELGADPSQETTELYLELLRRDAAGADALGTRGEVEMLAGLLHAAVLRLPDVEVPHGAGGWWQLAAELTTAS